MALDAFKPGDRVELVRHYSFWGDPSPQGTVVSTSNRRVRCKMDRSGKLIRFLPDDLRLVKRVVPRREKLGDGSSGLKAGGQLKINPRHSGGRRLTRDKALRLGTTPLRNPLSIFASQVERLGSRSSLALQLPDCGLALLGGQLAVETSVRVLERRISVHSFGAAQQT